MRSLFCILFILSIATVSVAGEIYGTITDAAKPVAAGIKVDVTIAGKN